MPDWPTPLLIELGIIAYLLSIPLLILLVGCVAGFWDWLRERRGRVC